MIYSKIWKVFLVLNLNNSVADPGFPRGGANPKGAPTYYLTNFPGPENCTKLKKFWPGRGHTSLASPRSATAANQSFLPVVSYFKGI